MAPWDAHTTRPSDELRSYLRPGELIVWSGRPDPEQRFSAADAFLIPFSVLWGGFAITWELGVLTSGAPPFFVLWGIPFVAAGFYFMIGRFIYKRRTKLRTEYCLTSERALVKVGTTTVQDSPINNTPTTIKWARDGSHVSVTFGTQSVLWGGGMYADTGMDFLIRGNSPVAFYDVADGQALLDAMNHAPSAR